MKRTGSKYQPIGERRQIETWNFWRKQTPDYNPDGNRLDFKVYLLCNASQKSTRFECIAQDGPKVVGFEGNDIFELRRKAEEYANGVKEIKWRSMLWVQTNGGKASGRHWYSKDKKVASVSIEYSPLQCGVRGKEKCHQFEDRDIREGWPDTGKNPDKDMAALIDDTPENRAKLDQLINGIDLIAGRIKELMAPKKIMETLGRIDPGRALPFFPQPSNGELAGHP